uniref:restriction endonuclease subunit S n=1 Tax=Lachnoclostridium phocaeense TaxID=1871021 RepID=UPI0026DBD1DE|nr:restriction endonuclease subunit S [Lachnoclostridium phocaeense]
MKCIEDEIPFEVPEGWAWARLASICEIITKGASPKWQGVDYTTTGTLFVTSENIGIETLLLESPKYLSNRINEIQPRSVLKKHDVLTNIVGASIGRTCEYSLDKLANTNQAVAIIRLVDLNLVDFIVKCLNSAYCIDLMLKNQVNVARANLSLSSLANFLIPIPPISEKHRIIEKVTLLFSQVAIISEDQLALKTIVSKTKAKILDLAIRGQLVEQNPNDEPASALLERIRTEKEELIKQGKIKRDKKESFIFKGADNSYYLKTGDLVESLEGWDFEEIPDNWTICCLGEMCNYGNCTNVNTVDVDEFAWILDLEDIEKDTGVVKKKVRKAERNTSSTKHLFYKGQVLYSKLRPYLNKVVLADEDGFCTSEILPLKFERNVLPQYARYYLMSPTFLRYANKCSYGVKMPRLGTADGKKALIPIPPIEEQKRIVVAIEQTFIQLNSIAENLS